MKISLEFDLVEPKKGISLTLPQKSLILSVLLPLLLLIIDIKIPHNIKEIGILIILALAIYGGFGDFFRQRKLHAKPIGKIRFEEDQLIINGNQIIPLGELSYLCIRLGGYKGQTDRHDEDLMKHSGGENFVSFTHNGKFQEYQFYAEFGIVYQSLVDDLIPKMEAFTKII